MDWVKDKKNIKKILIFIIILSIFTLLLFNLIKFNNKNIDNDNFSKKMGNVILVSYQNDIINKDNIEKLYDFILTLKNNKNFHYEFKRQIEKRNLIDVLVDKEEFSLIFSQKEKYFDKITLDSIENQFGSYENFINLFYYFYVSLFFSQIDDKIPELERYKKSLEDKLYKIRPEVLNELKQKLEKVNDLKEKEKIQDLINELSKNIYKDLNKNQKKLLEDKINEIKQLLDMYNDLKDKDYYKWVLENKEKILEEIRY
ncbi:MAG: hypothetical protein N2485_02790 [bacterium]|nr:hypothetical protein [bacterium]